MLRCGRCSNCVARNISCIPRVGRKRGPPLREEREARERAVALALERQHSGMSVGSQDSPLGSRPGGFPGVPSMPVPLSALQQAQLVALSAASQPPQPVAMLQMMAHLQAMQQAQSSYSSSPLGQHAPSPRQWPQMPTGQPSPEQWRLVQQAQAAQAAQAAQQAQIAQITQQALQAQAAQPAQTAQQAQPAQQAQAMLTQQGQAQAQAQQVGRGWASTDGSSSRTDSTTHP